MSIEKKPFVSYGEKKAKAPLPVKTNETEDLLIEVGQYMFNLESRSGVLKRLAKIGLKVLLRQFTADEFHYLTSGERTRYQYKRPDVEKLSRELSLFPKRYNQNTGAGITFP